MTFLIRGASTLDGERLDLALDKGVITAVSQALPRGDDELDASGMTLLPGLWDHHLHILALAARRLSVDLSGCADEAGIRKALSAAPGPILRAIGYDDNVAGLPDRAMLDHWSPCRPLRVQDRTGALWVLNSIALAQLPTELPPGAERDAHGALTGRFWREDAWLGAHWARQPPSLAALGSELARYGLTGLTDAGPANGPAAACILGEAHGSGALPQRLVLMGDETLPAGEHYRRGPLKLLYDESNLLDFEAVTRRIVTARGQNRTVAAHCVTAAELAFFLAALDEAGGVRSGDRVEHGAVITPGMVEAIATTGLTVVTNPGFVHDRGERYRATIAATEQNDLYRAASLTAADIALAAGSDAPYASPDPWLAMRAARDRLTSAGNFLGRDERLSARQALALYLGDAFDPSRQRQLAPGSAADLILCEGIASTVLSELEGERVAATFIAGVPVFRNSSV